MAQISLTVNFPDDKAADIQDTLARAYGYNGEGTKNAWIKASIIKGVKEVYKNQKTIDAQLAAEVVRVAQIEAAKADAENTNFN